MNIKNARGQLTTSMATLYTAPAGGARVAMIHITNIDLVAEVLVTLQWTDASAGNVATKLANQRAIPKTDALSVLAGVLYLEGGDAIQGQASAAGDADVTISILES